MKVPSRICPLFSPFLQCFKVIEQLRMNRAPICICRLGVPHLGETNANASEQLQTSPPTQLQRLSVWSAIREHCKTNLRLALRCIREQGAVTVARHLPKTRTYWGSCFKWRAQPNCQIAQIKISCRTSALHQVVHGATIGTLGSSIAKSLMVSCYFLLTIYSLQWLIQSSGRCHKGGCSMLQHTLKWHCQMACVKSGSESRTSGPVRRWKNRRNRRNWRRPELFCFLVLRHASNPGIVCSRVFCAKAQGLAQEPLKRNDFKTDGKDSNKHRLTDWRKCWKDSTVLRWFAMCAGFGLTWRKEAVGQELQQYDQGVPGKSVDSTCCNVKSTDIFWYLNSSSSLHQQLNCGLLVQVAAWGNKVSSRWLPSVRQLEGLTHLKWEMLQPKHLGDGPDNPVQGFGESQTG